MSDELEFKQKLAEAIYKKEEPFGTPWAGLKESERWQYYDMATELLGIVSAAGLKVEENSVGKLGRTDASGSGQQDRAKL